MISVSEQRSLRQDRSGAGKLQCQLESVRKLTDKAHFARGDKEQQ